MFLTLIETSANQDFIFSTNKLKENIGASELTYRAGTKWVIDAVAAELPHTPLLRLWTADGGQLRRNLLNPKLNPAIEDKSSLGIEIILAASGKAMLLTNIRETAQNIIRHVTRTALKSAPGLNIYGFIQEFDWNSDCLGKIVRDIHREFDVSRSQKMTPLSRFQRLPVVQSCSSSGQPATGFSSTYGQQQPVSHTSLAKINAFQKAHERLRSLHNEPVTEFAGTTSELDEICDWLAIVHADGNGLGKIFQNFHNHIGATNPSHNRDYVNQLRRFSLALDQCAVTAFRKAIQVFKRIDNKTVDEESEESSSQLIPLTPLILGGDDMTVICDGRYALQFTHKFLNAFEEETASLDYFEGIVPKIAKKALHADHLSACAGVTIIKPHFPFSVAYGLAESLIKSAKIVKQQVRDKSTENSLPYPCSAIDFHILYDSSVVDLDAIREQLISQDGLAQLYSRPYVVTPINLLASATQAGQQWSEYHHWHHLSRRVAALQATTDERDRQLPNSQMHQLRSSLFQGKVVSDAQFSLIQNRYKHQGIEQLTESGDSLFLQSFSGQAYCTRFLDALESVDFFKVAGEE